ncbi:MAG: DEAD/DEAH box helicase [Burkholderiaceae bacterium]|jgi:ATP-dependent RNA helicase RhlE|nr:DEAD/DEAH box helicase [Burkholderiaceae bacterium]
MSFASLGLADALLRAVADVGYTDPTPIQKQAIPAVLEGRDLLAGAQTGTGKTAGFVLPILQRLMQTPAQGKRPIRVLILTPTRELAAQVEESVRTYGKHVDVKSTMIFGGVSINPQITALKEGVDIVVATPGRLLDHHGQKTIDLSKVEVLVLDEADRMLDMGFIHDIKRVLKIVPPKRQNLLFSATFSDEIRDLANGLLNSPQHIQVTPRNTTVEAVAQKVLTVDAKRKPELLIHLIKEHNWFQVLVFTRTKHGANKLAAQLVKHDITALPIHGNKSQNARTRALAEFKSSKLQVLVATDIAARGIDIDELPHVVNFDLPNVPEDYVHRIGRTGRAGATGEALSLVSPDEMTLLRDIERFTKRALPREVVPGFEHGTPSKLPEPTHSEERTPHGQSRREAHHNAPRRERHPQGPRRGQGAGQEGKSRQGAGGEPRSGEQRSGAARPPQAPRKPKPAQPQGGQRQQGGERGDEKILADPNAYLNALPFDARGGRGKPRGGPRGGQGQPWQGRARGTGTGGGQQGQRGQGGGGQPQPRGEVDGNNARGGAQTRQPWREDAAGVRSNLPPGWPGSGNGRR